MLLLSTDSEESKIRKSMIHFQEELKSREFLSVDKGMMVNIRHIMKIKDYEIFMRDGVRIPVGNYEVYRSKECCGRLLEE